MIGSVCSANGIGIEENHANVVINVHLLYSDLKSVIRQFYSVCIRLFIVLLLFITFTGEI